MPIYEYRCDDCGRSFEALVSATRPESECPDCRGTKLVRELSVFASSRGGSGPAANGGGGCCGGGCGCR